MCKWQEVEIRRVERGGNKEEINREGIEDRKEGNSSGDQKEMLENDRSIHNERRDRVNSARVGTMYRE